MAAASPLAPFLLQIRTAVASVGQGPALAIAATFVLVVGGIGGTAYWAGRPTWALLATDVDAEAMNGVVERLRALKIEYALDPGGRTVRVDASRVDELRMQLAAEGLPASGRIGFELFDRTLFGATELTEKVNFQRALEGELARTIGSLGSVAAARVHLALPRASLFAEQVQPAKASVVLRLTSGRGLAASEVDGIVRLVASSVEGLSPESVTVIDTSGRRLSRLADPADAAPDRGRFDRQQQIERDLAARVVALLEPVVGVGRVRANVSATLKSDSEDETEERWDPTAVVRSRQSTIEADGRQLAQGAAGARANLPADPPAPVAAPTPPPALSNNRSSEVTNYELSKITRRRVSPPGQLSRLSVAVLVDGVRHPTAGSDASTVTPRGAEELQRLHQLVASAVGIVPERGDQLTVENIAFDTLAFDVPEPAPGTSAERPLSQRLRDEWPSMLPGLAAVVFAISVLVFIARRRGRPVASPGVPERLASTSAIPATALPQSGAASVGQDALDALPPSPARQIAKLARSEPEQLARIIRGWLAEEERER